MEPLTRVRVPAPDPVAIKEDRHDPAPRHLTVVGRTTDGKFVVKFFRIVETHGVPLEDVLDSLKENDLVPDWIDFWRESQTCKWHPERTLHRLELAVESVYGPEYLVEWKKRMYLYLAAVAERQCTGKTEPDPHKGDH